MTLAWASVAALVLAVALSVLTKINVGILSLAMAWLVGVYLGGMSVNAVLSGFPVPLLVTLVGVTLLFSMADTNGTLSRLTGRAVRLCRGNAGLLPIMFFALGVVVSTIGPGGTPASALLAAPAMAVAGRVGISPLLMAIMTGNGALAGTLSPFAPGGVIANDVMARIGLGGLEWQTYGYNVLAHVIVGTGGFVLFGGPKLLRRREGDAGSGETEVELLRAQALADPRRHLGADRRGGRLRRARGPDRRLHRRAAHSPSGASTSSRPFGACRGASS